MLRWNKEALLVFILLAVTYGYFFQDPGGNGNTRLGLTFAFVKEGRLTIDSYQDNTAVNLFTYDKSFYNGHYYTDKAIGSSVIAAIFYFPMFWLMQLTGHNWDIQLVKQLLTFFVIGLPSALCGSLIYILCQYLSGSKVRAFFVTAAIVLGTMCFPFSITFFSHQLAASLLFFGFFAIFQLKVQPDSDKIGRLFLIGILLGLALITEYPTILVILPLIGYYLFVLWKTKRFRWWRHLMIPALGGLIPVMIMIVYNVICFGKPFAIGYEYLTDPYFKAGMAEGFMGIGLPHPRVLFFETLHPAMGLFWQSPVLLMIFIGAYFMLRKKGYRAEGLLSLFVFGAFLLMNAGYYMWWGGYSFGPRSLIPMLPFLSLPLIFVPRRLFFLVILLTLVSVTQMFIVASSDILAPDKIMEDIRTIGYFEYSAIYNYCFARLLDGKFAVNLGQQLLGLKTWASLLPIALVDIVGTIYMLFFSSTRKRQTAEM